MTSEEIFIKWFKVTHPILTYSSLVGLFYFCDSNCNKCPAIHECMSLDEIPTLSVEFIREHYPEELI